MYISLLRLFHKISFSIWSIVSEILERGVGVFIIFLENKYFSGRFLATLDHITFFLGTARRRGVGEQMHGEDRSTRPCPGRRRDASILCFLAVKREKMKQWINKSALVHSRVRLRYFSSLRRLYFIFPCVFFNESVDVKTEYYHYLMSSGMKVSLWSSGLIRN